MMFSSHNISEIWLTYDAMEMLHSLEFSQTSDVML